MNTDYKPQKYINISTTLWRFWPLAFILAIASIALSSIVVQLGISEVYGDTIPAMVSSLGEMFAKIIAILLGILLIFGFVNGDKREAVGWTRKKLPQIIFLGIIGALLFNGFMYIWELLIHGGKEGLKSQLDTMGFGKTAIGDIAIIFAITVLAPVGEEILFRGVAFRSMFSGLSKYKKIGGSIALIIGTTIVSYLFADMHLGGEDAFYFIIPYFVLALVCTFVYVYTGSLYTAIITHSINNSFVILVALFTFVSVRPATDLVYIIAFLGPVISFGITYLLEKVFFSRKG